jgi:hypothetical protein
MAELSERVEAESRTEETKALFLETFAASRQHQLLLEERYRELNDQAVKVLNFEAAVLVAREKIRHTARVQSSGLTASRGLHEGCVFHKKHFEVAVKPDERLRQLDAIAKPVAVQLKDQQSLSELLRQQVVSYIGRLFLQFEKTSVGREEALVDQYAGRESELVLALEQRFNVHFWTEQNLRDRVAAYYRIMAPDRMGEEMNRLLQRFAGAEGPLWAFLESRYGPNPLLQTAAMRVYLKDRLTRYLTRRAPQLLPDVNSMVSRCKDNGDALFLELTGLYGPEDSDVVCDTATRKLRTFFKVRGIARPVDNAQLIVKRFAGMEHELNRMLREKFGADLFGVLPDV